MIESSTILDCLPEKYLLLKIVLVFCDVVRINRCLKKQKQPPEMFYKKGVLKNFTKFTGKHLR